MKVSIFRIEPEVVDKMAASFPFYLSRVSRIRHQFCLRDYQYLKRYCSPKWCNSGIAVVHLAEQGGLCAFVNLSSTRPPPPFSFFQGPEQITGLNAVYYATVIFACCSVILILNERQMAPKTKLFNFPKA